MGNKKPYPGFSTSSFSSAILGLTDNKRNLLSMSSPPFPASGQTLGPSEAVSAKIHHSTCSSSAGHPHNAGFTKNPAKSNPHEAMFSI